MLQLPPLSATAEEILVDLVKLIKNAECHDHDLSDLSGSTLSLSCQWGFEDRTHLWRTI